MDSHDDQNAKDFLDALSIVFNMNVVANFANRFLYYHLLKLVPINVEGERRLLKCDDSTDKSDDAVDISDASVDDRDVKT